MDYGALIKSLAGVAVGAGGTYAAFYMKAAASRREQIAKCLADFYSSAATAFYAFRDYERMPDSDPGRVKLYGIFDQRYKEFLSASTFLAALVPPFLREDVLGIEDAWDELADKGVRVASDKAWLDLLDTLRYKILDSVKYYRLLDPFWIRRGRSTEQLSGSR